MQRTYNGTVADDLSYTFASNSNRLTAVQDNGNNTFVKNGTNSYTYDANGNLLTDSGKGVSNITYNYLNLPQQITTATGTITYSYTATGQKLRMSKTPLGIGCAYVGVWKELSSVSVGQKSQLWQKRSLKCDYF